MKKLYITCILACLLLGACVSREQVAQEAAHYLAYMEVIAKHAEQSIEPLRVAYDQAIAMGADEDRISLLKDLINEAEAKLPSIRQELANAQKMAADAAASHSRWAFISAIITGLLGSGIMKTVLGGKLALVQGALNGIVAGVESYRTDNGLKSEETLALDTALRSKMLEKDKIQVRGSKKKQNL